MSRSPTPFFTVGSLKFLSSTHEQLTRARIVSGGCTEWSKITSIVAYRLVAILISLVLPRNLYYMDHDSIFRFCIANAIAKCIY